MNKLDKDYQKLLQDILDNGVQKGDRTGTGTLSVFGREIRHKMSDGFPLLTTKKMAWKPIVIELIWFLQGNTNIQYLVQNGCYIWVGDAYKNYCKYTSQNSSEWNEWMKDNGDDTLSMFTREEFIEKIKIDNKFAEKWGDMGPIYGKQWRHWNISNEAGGGYIDQIEALIQNLKENPNSRRLLVNAWNVSEIHDMVLPPCHYGFECWARKLSLDERVIIAIEKKSEIKKTSNDGLSDWCDSQNIPKYELSLKWIQRSVDTPLGLPFNIASYGLLLLMIADEVNMIPGELIGSLGDTHIYLNQIYGIKEQLTKEPFQLPTVYVRDGIECSSINDIILKNYKSHEKINFPLSN